MGDTAADGETTPTDEQEDPTQHHTHRGPSWAQIVRDLQPGDRVHIEVPAPRNEVQWRSYWVTAAGDEYAEFGKYRVEVTDEDIHVRTSRGDGGVKLLEDQNGEWFNGEFTESLNDIERVPAAAFEDRTWYRWEVGVSESRMGGISTDKTVITEAPSKEIAQAKAKRWAAMSSGYTAVTYQEDKIEPPAASQPEAEG